METTIPPHIPPELVVDLDYFNLFREGDDPQTTWRQFKGKGPLVYSPYNGGHWIATSGSDVANFYRDVEHFSSSEVSIPALGPVSLLPAQSDSPEHADHRRNVNYLFTPAAVERLSPQIRDLTVELIEGFRAKGECDFVTEFSQQLPLSIFLSIMHLPLEDRILLHKISLSITGSGDEDRRSRGMAELHEYIDGWIQMRVDEPGDDPFTTITKSQVNGRPYTRREMLATATNLLLAGLDTVANLLSFLAYDLARFPKHRDYIRENPDKMNQITQELLRRYAVFNSSRVVVKDYSHNGVEMRRGDRILLPTSLFNMDEALTDNPDSVDLSRNNARHITFGSGPHTCVGAMLARKEMTIFLEEWLKRMPDYSLDPARPPKFRVTQINSVDSLWLKWDVQSLRPIPAG